MKLRIKSDTLRLRLSQSEVERFKVEGRESDSIDFGSRKLIYTIQVVDQPEVTADYDADFIVVNVPPAIADNWTGSEQVGFDAVMSIDNERKLYILVEKDFQCLKPREGEDESDLFDHPEGHC